MVTNTEPKVIQRKRVKRVGGWKMPPNTVYVGRPTIWGNYFESRIDSLSNRRRAYQSYKDWLSGKLDGRAGQRRQVLERMSELRGIDLACWCSDPDTCHATVLLALANA